MYSSRVCLLLILCLVTLPALAERPRIGLALAGGGAKGSAHIAVLEALEANNIPVDYIAGTSIGAYVGGLYALGYNAAEIKEIMFSADLGRGYTDTIRREDLPYRVKRQKDRFNVPLEIGYRDRRIRLPGGLLYGQTMSGIYRNSVGNIPRFDSFDDLAIPFRAIATDLTNSDTVTLGSGNLIKAMQASATVPGALVPIEIDDRILVDGGLSENLPISQVKRMGADIVIAVDISAPLRGKDELTDHITVLRQISNFLTQQNIEQQIQLLEKDDVYIRPRVDNLSTTDFSALPEAYAAGKDAVEAQLPQLRQLAIDTDAYQQYRQRKQEKLEALDRAAQEPVVRIILRNRSRVSNDLILGTLGFPRGVSITTAQLIAAVERVYALDRFERVDAEFEQRDEGRVLIIEARAKSWGPNHFEMGVGWEDDFTLDSIINLDFAYTLGNITPNNGEWRNEIGIGTNKSLRSEVYLPLDNRQQYYHSTLYEFRREARDSFIENQRAVIFDFTTHRLDLGLGYKWLDAGIVEAGLTFQRGYISNDLFLPEDLEYTSPGFYLRVGYDSLDRISFPSRGTRLTLSVTHREEDVSGALLTGVSSTQGVYRSTQYLADWKGAASQGNHGLVGKISLAYLDSEVDQSIHFVQLGGFLNLSGYHKNALVGNIKAFVALSYQYDLGRSLLGLRGFPVYVGTSIEAGNVWLASESDKLDDLITAGSIFVGTDTKLGPVALAIGFADGDNNSVYFYLGKNI